MNACLSVQRRILAEVITLACRRNSYGSIPFGYDTVRVKVDLLRWLTNSVWCSRARD